MPEAQVAQRGRALIAFQASTAKAVTRLRARAERELATQGLTADTLPDDMNERHRAIDAALTDSKTFKVHHLLGEWRAKMHGPVCTDAFEEVRAELEPKMAAADVGPTTLEFDPDIKLPDYYSKVWFHRTAGGWDASEHNGYIHGELIHKLLLTEIFGGDIFEQRRAAAEALPRRDYQRILDVGASSGHFTLALAETFPAAEITGIDFSPSMLQHARRTANERGLAWKLFVRAGEDTKFSDGTFDAVVSYNLLHEVPPRIIKALMAEAFRVLAPGGDMLMADVPRYGDIDKLASWRYDIVARFGGEPHWRASATADLAAMAREAGFVDVQARGLGLGPNGHPYVVGGRKPA